MTREPGFETVPSFCGNCGTAVEPGSVACGTCGQPVAGPVPTAEAIPQDYIPYCRNCGVGVPWGRGHSCQQCGVTPLCDLHFRSATGLCLDCSAVSPVDVSQYAGQAQGLSCRRCGGSLFPGAEFCPQCGLPATLGTAHAVEYMGFWIRFAAFVADWIIAYVVAALVAAVIGISLTSGDVDPQAMEELTVALENFNYSFVLLFCGIWTIYSLVMTALKGQTLGKMLLRIQVVDEQGNIPPWHRSVARELLRGVIVLALIPLGLLYLWVGMDSRKRGPHDYLTGCYVVRRVRNRGGARPF